MSLPKVIAFDLFGTLFDMSSTTQGEREFYTDQTKVLPWIPLTLPETWRTLPVFPDVRDGIKSLRRHCAVVTLSNAPMSHQIDMLVNAGLGVDGIIPLESRNVYKPNPWAYYVAADIMGVHPSSMMMVTANRKFGDLEQSIAAGMKAALLCRYDKIMPAAMQPYGQFADVLSLADYINRLARA